MFSLRIVLALACLGTNLAAWTGDLTAWASVQRLAPGQSVEVVNQKGESFSGKLESVSEESIVILGKHHTATVPRTAVKRVQIRGSRRLRCTLIGAGIGAGAGLGLGAAGAESLANSSGGDFANLKPAIIGASGAAGALIGAVVGSAVGNRGTTVYRIR
ncbi:MAG TPA: hypothetical protein VMH81_15620 [Bryobacteraceae bacterium]|nr:hypothetical protein [Bryobacteraceae bacterium]